MRNILQSFRCKLKWTILKNPFTKHTKWRKMQMQMNSSSPAGSIHIHNDCNKQTRANNGSIWAHIITTINAFITGESVSVLAECPHCTPNSPFTQPHVLRSRTVKRSYSLCHFFLARAHKCTANGKKNLTFHRTHMCTETFRTCPYKHLLPGQRKEWIRRWGRGEGMRRKHVSNSIATIQKSKPKHL